MFIFKLLISFMITVFVFTKFVIADELEDRVKELESKIAEMENKGSGTAADSSGSKKIYGNESSIKYETIPRSLVNPASTLSTSTWRYAPFVEE